jgi:hypothetical protein
VADRTSLKRSLDNCFAGMGRPFVGFAVRHENNCTWVYLERSASRGEQRTNSPLYQSL